MTLWAILSDVHGRGDRLARVLDDARAHGVTQVLSLGDVGGVDVIERLDNVGALHVFGNWEASGLRGLPRPYRAEVAGWPAYINAGSFQAAHASPVWPDGLDAASVVGYLQVHELRWTDLFPSLAGSAEARQAVFSGLQTAGIPLCFHGHTHVQEVWRCGPDGIPEVVPRVEFDARAEGACWLVGVGSVGAPANAGGPCYALYDDVRRYVTLRQLDRLAAEP